MTIETTRKFKDDLKLVRRQRKDIDDLLDKFLDYLERKERLPEEYRDHKLVGNYKDCRECHIDGRKSNLLLIYKIKGDELVILKLMRIGSHQNLFNEDVLQDW